MRKAVKVGGVGAGLFLAFGAGLSAGGYDSAKGTTAAPSASTVTVTASPSVAAPSVATHTITTTATVTATAKPPGAEATMGPGVWVVGQDIKAGTYRTTAAVEDGCYWEINARVGSDDIVQNDNPQGGRPQVVLRAGQVFTSARCGDWGRLR